MSCFSVEDNLPFDAGATVWCGLSGGVFIIDPVAADFKVDIIIMEQRLFVKR